jgi:hypothetical protein
VAETEAEALLAAPPGFELLDQRTTGAAAITALRWHGPL